MDATLRVKLAVAESSDPRPVPTSRTTSAKPMFLGLTDRGADFVLSTRRLS
jgi:hypothetical protein